VEINAFQQDPAMVETVSIDSPANDLGMACRVIRLHLSGYLCVQDLQLVHNRPGNLLIFKRRGIQPVDEIKHLQNLGRGKAFVLPRSIGLLHREQLIGSGGDRSEQIRMRSVVTLSHGFTMARIPASWQSPQRRIPEVDQHHTGINQQQIATWRCR
jgi:hypothetical protein